MANLSKFNGYLSLGSEDTVYVYCSDITLNILRTFTFCKIYYLWSSFIRTIQQF